MENSQLPPPPPPSETAQPPQASQPSQPVQSHRKTRMKRTSAVAAVAIIACILLAGFGGYMLSNLGTSTKLADLQNQVTALTNTDSPQYQVVPQNVDLSQFYLNVRDSVVVISGLEVQTSFFGQQVLTQVEGSGFVDNLTGRMVIVTNDHVIDGIQNISVTFRNGDAYSAKVLGNDPDSDLGVLSVDAPANEFVPLQIISSSTLQVGDFVAAVGSPFGLAGSMTTGIVSQLGRTITESTTSFPIGDVIQTSAPINPGNSGGPLLNAEGQVVGINTAGITDSQGVGFAIPSSTILREITTLVDSGSYKQHPWLGIQGTDMTFDIANQAGLKVTYGMLIEQVTSGGPSEKAGLKGGSNQITVDGNTLTVGGDIIAAINGTRIVNGDALSTYLEENTLPNQTINVTVVRNGQTTDIPVVLGTRPSQSNA